MAKLGSYYGLCPLTDNKSLLGVSEDVTAESVIVTLGKNVAIKYKLSDQKQLQSWSTKEKLSSPVIYDKKENRYLAVFNQFFLRFWTENDKHLKKLKKIKFPLPIHTILANEEDPIIVFKTGRILTLSYALEIRKDIPLNDIYDKPSSIEDQICLNVNGKNYVGLLVKSEQEYFYYWTSPEKRTEDDCTKNFKIIQLKRPRVKLNGHVVMIRDNEPILFSLWTDGRLYSHSLTKNAPESFYCVIESLSRQQPICLLALNSTYLAMYGADVNQEGASLQIYNIQFKVTQTKLQMKLFTLGSKLWLINDSILLTVGQNLAVVPFHLATEQLAALVGSHKLTSINDDDEVVIVTEIMVENWGSTQIIENTPDSVEKRYHLEDFLKEGWSEAAICEEVFPKFFEKNDIKAILNCLNYFSDIPETSIVNVLSYTLKNIISSENSDITNNGIGETFRNLLDRILTIPYSDVILLPKLRAGLNFDEILVLLQYICFLLSGKGHKLPKSTIVESERKLIDWGCILLDSHYQQLLLSKNIETIKSLEYFKTLTDTYMLCLKDLKKLEPVLGQIKSSKKQMKTNTCLKYSIENLNLY